MYFRFNPQQDIQNQISSIIERQVLRVVRQSLKILHKIYMNLSRWGHKSQMVPIEDNWRYFFIYLSNISPDNSKNLVCRDCEQKIGMYSGKSSKKHF